MSDIFSTNTDANAQATTPTSDSFSVHLYADKAESDIPSFGDVVRAAPLAAVGGIATTASSLTLGYVDKEDIANAMLDNAVGHATGMHDQYAKNPELYNTVGEIGTMLIGGGLALSALKGVRIASTAARAVGAITEAGAATEGALGAEFIGTVGSAIARTAAPEASNLEILRNNLQSKVVSYAQNGVVNLPENAGYRAAVANISRTGVLSAVDDSLTLATTQLALLNQSDLFYPESPDGRHYISQLGLDFAAGTLVGGLASLGITAYKAASAIKQGGILATKAEQAIVADSSIGTTARVSALGEARAVAADSGIEQPVRDAATRRAVVLETALADDFNNLASKADNVTGGTVKLGKAEIENLLGDAKKGLPGLGPDHTANINNISDADVAYGGWAKRSLDERISIDRKLKDLGTPADQDVVGNDKLVELNKRRDELAKLAPTIVHSDGSIMPVAFAKRDLSSYNYDVNYSAGEKAYTLKINGLTNNNTVKIPVETIFEHNVDLSQLSNAQVQGVYALNAKALASKAIDGAIIRYAGGVAIDLEKTAKNYALTDALITKIAQSSNDQKEMLLSRVKLPVGYVGEGAAVGTNLQQLRDYAAAQKFSAAQDFIKTDNAAAKNATPFDMAQRFGLNFANKDGTATGLYDALLAGKAANLNFKAASLTEGNLQRISSYYSNLGNKLSQEELNATAQIPINRDLINYPWETKPLAIWQSKGQVDETNVVMRKMIGVNEQSDRVDRLKRASLFVAQVGENDAVQATTPIGKGLVDRLTQAYSSTSPQLVQAINDGALGNALTRTRNIVSEVFQTPSAKINSVAAATAGDAYRKAIQPIVDKFTTEVAKDTIRTANALNVPKNLAERNMYNDYAAAVRTGLPLLPGFDDAGRVLVDRNNPLAAKMWKVLTGQEMPDGNVYLPKASELFNGKVEPVAVTGLARQHAENMHELAANVRAEENGLRYASKNPAIEERSHYLPYVQEFNKEQAFIVDRNGKMVAGVPGRTVDGVSAVASEAIAKLQKADPTNAYSVVTSRTVNEYRAVHGAAASDALNLFDNAAGKSSYAQWVKPDADNTVIAAHISEYARRLQDVARGHTALAFKEAVSANAYQESLAAAKTSFKNVRGEDLRTKDDDFSIFREALFGKPDAKPEGAINKIEQVTNQGLDYVANALRTNANIDISNIKKAVTESLTTGRDGNIANAAAYVKDKLGFAPFDKAVERLANTTSYKADPGLRDLLAKANIGASQLLIRILEPAQGIIHAITPAVMGSSYLKLFNILPGETAAARQARLGYLATVVNDQAIPSTHGALLGAVKEAFNPEFQAWMKSMAADGQVPKYRTSYFNLAQEAKGLDDSGRRTLINRMFDQNSGIFTAPTRFGDHIGETLAYAMARNTLRASGADVSDDIVKAMATGMMQRIQGNYLEKAPIYQTTVGMPFGVFQSYMTNYMNNMMEAIVSKNYASLGTLYAMQAGVFGAESVGGYRELQQNLFRNWDGSKNIDDHIEESFGRTASDLIMHGPLWSVPKIFGADGLSMFTRGDANFRASAPGLQNFENLPGVYIYAGVLKSMAGAMKYAASGGNNDAAKEYAIASMPNRTIRGFLESIQGFATDGKGHMTKNIAEDGWGAALTRTLGLKGMAEVNTAHKTYRMLGENTKQRAYIANLNATVGAAVRAGDAQDVNQLVVDYVQHGGNPNYFNRWYRHAQGIAVEEKAPARLKRMEDRANNLKSYANISKNLSE